MTSTVQWVGSPKSRQKEQNQLICDSDRGEEGVKKSKKIADVIYGIRHPRKKPFLWSTFNIISLLTSP